LARGYVGRAKNGLMPLHGDASLQGAAEMGAHAEVFPGGKPINTYHASELRDHYGFPVPATPGLTIAEMLEVGRRGQLRVFYCVGGDLLCSAPQADSVTRAMSNIPIRVQQDTVLTKQALIDPKQQVLLLPAKNCHEQVDGGTQTTAERRVIFSPHIHGSHEGSGEAKEPWLILRELAATVSPELAHLLHCETGRALREEIARVNPLYGGIQRLEKYGEAFQYGGPHLCAGDTFPTADGKAHFRIPPLPSREELPELLSSREPVEADEMPDPARTLTVEEPKP
jgi:predicted molibdopterin-dependent oxidoreductase YjgC